MKIAEIKAKNESYFVKNVPGTGWDFAESRDENKRVAINNNNW